MNALDKAIKTIDAYSYKSAYQDLERAYRMHKNNKPLLKDMIKQWADRHLEKEARQALKDFEKQHGRMTDKAIKNMDGYSSWKQAYKDIESIIDYYAPYDNLIVSKIKEWYNKNKNDKNAKEAYEKIRQKLVKQGYKNIL